ncbi:MAG: hypothetical protein ABFD52_04840 [Acidobacteriota bacterium]
MSGIDLTDPRDNPLIPRPAAADPGNELVSPDAYVNEQAYKRKIDQAIGNVLAGEPIGTAAAAPLADLLGIFLQNSVTVEPGLVVERRASGDVMVIMDGHEQPIDQVTPEVREKIRAALQR